MNYQQLPHIPLLVDENRNIVGTKDPSDGEERLFAFIGDTVVGQTVVNKTDATIPLGSAVILSGAQGQRVAVELADASAEATSSKTFGVTYSAIEKNQNGIVVTQGMVYNVNTNGFNEGDALWLSETAGGLTNVRPTQPAHGVFMGLVVRKHHTQGSIFVKVSNGWELDELHNVLITNPQNGQSLKYNSALGLWTNQA